MIVIRNPSTFFIGLGVTPLVTIAELLGALTVPLLPSYIIASFVSKKLNRSLYKIWLAGTITLLAMMTVGTLRARYGI